MVEVKFTLPKEELSKLHRMLIVGGAVVRWMDAKGAAESLTLDVDGCFVVAVRKP